MTRHNLSRISARRLGAALGVLALLSAPALATPKTGAAQAERGANPPAVDPAAETKACLERAEQSPDSAMAGAVAWESRGGGDLARLCQAMAQFHLGEFEDAATRIEALVPTLGAASPEEGANLLARAGWSWLHAGKAERAEQAYSAALIRKPRDADLLIDRAFARADMEKFWDAVDDLSRAIEIRPNRAEPYVYRAGAYRALGNYSQAVDDVEQALRIEPRNAEALLLRGNLLALGGKLDAARQDWQQVVQGNPGTESARVAAQNLERVTQPEPPKAPGIAPGQSD